MQVKLGALARERWGPIDGSPGRFPSGASLLDPERRVAWILIEHADGRALGGALAWARRSGAGELRLLVETTPDVSGLLSRQAAAFTTPISVWQVEDRALIPAAPAPLFPSAPVPAEAIAFADMLRAYGAEPVVEFGVLTGEVLGLEVARVTVDDYGAHLEVGVGRHDRAAGRLLFPDRAPGEALAATIALVRQLRTADSQPHLANRLAPERWLRAVVVARPELVAADYLAPAPSAVPRVDLGTPFPAPAAGVDAEGRPVVVVCSTGVDLNLVPAAADARLADGRDGCRLVLAVPAGDDYPATRELAGLLREPATVVTVPAGWRALSPVA
ncbi:MAG TPA: hypothetical protein VLL25_17920 [Acidimicrobiales bacterium]|nr:hypothetical protein [Acidimicrobiales bacterium]